MNELHSNVCQLLLADPNAVYPPKCQASACLEEKQAQELARLRLQTRNLCEAGEDDEAQRVAAIAHNIILEGPPTREG